MEEKFDVESTASQILSDTNAVVTETKEDMKLENQGERYVEFGQSKIAVIGEGVNFDNNPNTYMDEIESFKMELADAAIKRNKKFGNRNGYIEMVRKAYYDKAITVNNANAQLTEESKKAIEAKLKAKQDEGSLLTCFNDTLEQRIKNNKRKDRFKKTRRNRLDTSVSKLTDARTALDKFNLMQKGYETPEKRIAKWESIFSLKKTADSNLAEAFADSAEEEMELKRRADVVYHSSLSRIYSKEVSISKRELFDYIESQKHHRVTSSSYAKEKERRIAKLTALIEKEETNDMELNKLRLSTHMDSLSKMTPEEREKYTIKEPANMTPEERKKSNEEQRKKLTPEGRKESLKQSIEARVAALRNEVNELETKDSDELKKAYNLTENNESENEHYFEVVDENEQVNRQQ